MYDPDLYERCLFTATECKTVDATVRADYGAVGLNTLSNLNIYTNERNTKGFIAALAWADLAVNVIAYQILLTSDLANGEVNCAAGDSYCTAATHYNTQNIGQIERVYVSASDQGYTGIDGTKAVSQLTINFTIVAVNNAPEIKTDRTEFQVLPCRLHGLIQPHSIYSHGYVAVMHREYMNM